MCARLACERAARYLGYLRPVRRAYGRPGPRGSVATMRAMASSAMTVRMPASSGDMMLSLSVNMGDVAGTVDNVSLAVNDDGAA